MCCAQRLTESLGEPLHLLHHIAVTVIGHSQFFYLFEVEEPFTVNKSMERHDPHWWEVGIGEWVGVYDFIPGQEVRCVASVPEQAPVTMARVLNYRLRIES